MRNGVENCSSKTGCRRQSRKKTIFKHFLKGILKEKLLAPKLRRLLTHHYRSLDAATPIRFTMFSCSITHAAAALSNLDAATTMRSAETELQNTKELYATVSEIAAPKPDGCRRQRRKKTILKHFLKGFLKGKLLAPKLRKFADKSLSQPGCSHSINNHLLQKTIVLRMQPRHQATLTQPFQCVLQPRLQETHRTTHTGTTIVAKHIEGTKRPQPQPPHTRGTFHRRLQPLYTEKHKVLCSGFLPKTKPMQHSCSPSNAICNHGFKKRIELRTQEQPLLQNT